MAVLALVVHDVVHLVANVRSQAPTNRNHICLWIDVIVVAVASPFGKGGQIPVQRERSGQA